MLLRQCKSGLADGHLTAQPDPLRSGPPFNRSPHINMITTTVLVTLAVAALARAKTCDVSRCNFAPYTFYKELGCKPVNQEGICCPTSYNCGDLTKRVPSKCYLRGHSFNAGSSIPSELTGYPCTEDCECIKTEDSAKINCKTIQCPVSDYKIVPTGCVQLHKPNTCCLTGLHCNNATGPLAKQDATCTYDGVNYVIGQKILPEEFSCSTCICGEGFDGSLKEPWCRNFVCGFELSSSDKVLQGCAPIFYASNECCPIDWRCPEKSDRVVKGEEGQSNERRGVCKHGKLTLNVGDKLNSNRSCLECTCSVPPLVSCLLNAHC